MQNLVSGNLFDLGSGRKKFGSGIRDKHLGSATLQFTLSGSNLVILHRRWRWAQDQRSPAARRKISQRTSTTSTTDLSNTCKRQCCGSESGSTGSTCFWASWIRIRIHQSEVWIRIRILLSPSKKSKKNLASYCFVPSFWLFIFENDVHVPSLVRGMDPRIQILIRIHPKMPWIRNTDKRELYFCQSFLPEQPEDNGLCPEFFYVYGEKCAFFSWKVTFSDVWSVLEHLNGPQSANSTFSFKSTAHSTEHKQLFSPKMNTKQVPFHFSDSVANPGCLSWILIFFHPVPYPTRKKR